MILLPNLAGLTCPVCPLPRRGDSGDSPIESPGPLGTGRDRSVKVLGTGLDQPIQPTHQRPTQANVATIQGTLAGSYRGYQGSVRALDRNRGNERNSVEDRYPWNEHEAVQDRNRGSEGRAGRVSMGWSY